MNKYVYADIELGTVEPIDFRIPRGITRISYRAPIVEEVILVTHEQDGTDTIKTATREFRNVTPQYAVVVLDRIEYYPEDHDG